MVPTRAPAEDWQAHPGLQARTGLYFHPLLYKHNGCCPHGTSGSLLLFHTPWLVFCFCFLFSFLFIQHYESGKVGKQTSLCPWIFPDFTYSFPNPCWGALHPCALHLHSGQAAGFREGTALCGPTVFVRQRAITAGGGAGRIWKICWIPWNHTNRYYWYLKSNEGSQRQDGREFGRSTASLEVLFRPLCMRISTKSSFFPGNNKHVYASHREGHRGS